jgi:V/A-type H+-transporting ATPase subunit C
VILNRDVSAYAAIQARVRAMYSTLFTAPVWSGLCEAGEFGLLIETIQQTAYGPYLSRIERDQLTPRRAIFQIKQRMADTYFAVIRLAPGSTRALLTQLYRHFEIDNLKAVLRGTVAGADWEHVLYVLFPLGPVTVLPAQRMMEAGNITAAVDLLRGTVYYDTLAHSMERYTAEQSLFPLEVALDLTYWRTLWRDVNQLPSGDRTQALRIVGSLVDMNNLMWAIRYRVYHHLSEEEIINYTLPFGHRVQDENIRSIAAGADIGQIVTRLYPALTGADALLQQPQGGLPELELQLQRQVADQCRTAFTGYPFHVGILLGYLILTEWEIQDLTVLIEAKAARMPVDQFASHLLMGCGTA